MECKTCNKFVRFENGYEVKWMFDAPVGMCTLFFCNEVCWKPYRTKLQEKVDKNKYKSDSVSYLYECNYEEFNDEFKMRYNREASEADWNLFVVKFNELRTEHISSGMLNGIHEIIEEYYHEDKEQVCDNCAELLNDEYCLSHNIHIVTKSNKEKTYCSECFNSCWADLKRTGWTHDEQSDDEDDKEECDLADDSCSAGHGCEMFCCDECGKKSEENDDTCYAMDGTFCNEGCLQNYIDLLREENPKKE
jgi:hypothetical protein